MLKPDDQVVRALLRLRASTDFSTVLAWLEESLQARREANDTAAPTHIQWGQGRAQELSDLLSYINDAPLAQQRFEASQARDGMRRRE